jgi:DNA (cytosine-5)-methyltransferase 1
MTGAASAGVEYIDVFSGIGGISLALRGYVDTVLYCEQNAYCQSVLVERMERGDLDRAPIHPDIKTLHMPQSSRARMIGGGFPCQDISTIGLQKGIEDGERSSLFYEIMRIVDECPSIDYVFLENVANIGKCGMKEVVSGLAQRGFNFQWTTKSASSMGAPHVRNRWFCLAVRDGAPTIELGNGDGNSDSNSDSNSEANDIMVDWTKEPCPRSTFKPSVKADESFDEAWIQRCQCLGNSVVPCVVRAAFKELARTSQYWMQMSIALSSYAVPYEQLDYPYADAGIVIKNVYYPFPNAPIQQYEAVRHAIPITVKHGDKEVKFQHFPTPRRGLCHASSLTDRSLRDLPTVLINSQENLAWLKRQMEFGEDQKVQSIVQANVHYIEWMMGYPKDWTRSSAFIKTSKTKSSVIVEAEVEDEAEGDGEGEADSKTKTKTNKKDIVKDKNKEVGGVKKLRLNGMHMFMRDHPGKDIREIARLWNALKSESKKKYSELAKAGST